MFLTLLFQVIYLYQIIQPHNHPSKETKSTLLYRQGNRDTEWFSDSLKATQLGRTAGVWVHTPNQAPKPWVTSWCLAWLAAPTKATGNTGEGNGAERSW